MAKTLQWEHFLKQILKKGSEEKIEGDQRRVNLYSGKMHETTNIGTKKIFDSGKTQEEKIVGIAQNVKIQWI